MSVVAFPKPFRRVSAPPALKVVKDKSSVGGIYAAGEDAAYETFCKIRWPETNGEPVCPRCQNGSAYLYRNRSLYKCKGCGYQYTPTSGTWVASRKMSYADTLAIVFMFACGAKGVSSCELSRNMGCQQGTAWRFTHKIRAAIMEANSSLMLSGEVEIDGATFGGHLKLENSRRDGFKKRIYQRKHENRKVIVVARQRGGRTLTFVGTKESSALFGIRAHVDRSAVIHADQAHAWDSLNKLFGMMRINHRWSFMAEGACTNNAESFFAMLRRSHRGVYHHWGAKHVAAYAAEIAWRRDHAHLTAMERTHALLGLLCRLKPRDATVSTVIQVDELEAA